MRNRAESPWLLLGAAAAGAAAALLLDGDPGRRRRESIAKGVASAGTGALQTGSRLSSAVSEGVSTALHHVSERLSDAAHLVSDKFNDATRAAREAGSDRLSGLSVHGLSEGVSGLDEGVAHSAPSAWHGAAHALADAVSGSGAKVSSLAASLLRRKTKIEKLRASLGPSLGPSLGLSALTGKLTDFSVPSVSWRDVEGAIRNRRPSLKLPAVSAVTGLILLGAGVYFLAFSPHAPRRRKMISDKAASLLSDVGELANTVGAHFSSSTDRDSADRNAGQVSENEPPTHLADLVRTAIAGVTGHPDDIHVTLRNGNIVLQGNASPEDYDAVVAAAERVAPGFSNELQAVAAD